MTFSCRAMAIRANIMELREWFTDMHGNWHDTFRLSLVSASDI